MAVCVFVYLHKHMYKKFKKQIIKIFFHLYIKMIIEQMQ